MVSYADPGVFGYQGPDNRSNVGWPFCIIPPLLALLLKWVANLFLSCLNSVVVHIHQGGGDNDFDDSQPEHIINMADI